jgi:hypothetical protein
VRRVVIKESACNVELGAGKRPKTAVEGVNRAPSPFWLSPRYSLYAKEPGFNARLFAVTRFIRLHQGAQKGNAANYWSLFEPHYKQNLYTNPKRTAKLFAPLK